MTQQGLDLIKKYEGLRLEAYKCPAGVWTIGYGHTKGVMPKMKISKVPTTKAIIECYVAR